MFDKRIGDIVAARLVVFGAANSDHAAKLALRQRSKIVRDIPPCIGPVVRILRLVVPVLLSRVTVQLLNLKMTMSFYMLCLAIMFAYCFSRVEVSDH